MVWVPAAGVLFGGCLVKSLGAGGLGYTADADLPGWVAAMEAVEAQGWKPQVVVPGHGRVGGVELLAHTAHLAAAARPSERKMAVTIDDLPLATWGAYRDAAHRRATVQGWCEAFDEAAAPVTGFFNLHRKAPKLVQAWIDCGTTLGNHTLTHLHPDKVPLKRYLADLVAGHEAVAALAPEGARITFRYPYLRRGFDPAVRDAIRATLTELDSPVAPVTVDTMDWWYAKRWSDARKAGDAAAEERYRQAWRWNLEETTVRAELLARELFGREPPQILLIHANEIGAAHIAGYLQWLRERGYTFVSLEEALADPAYAEPVTATSPTGDSQWLRLQRERAGP